LLEGADAKRVSTAFPYLRTLKLYQMDFSSSVMNVVLTSIRGSVNDLCLIKSLLAGSPLLQKMVICARPSEMFGGESGFTTKLLKLHRASPIAEIDITWL
ncbi:hypothetical protein Tco_1323369, partial [Tanacetum coccineum]